ncbi:alpha/beta fold hydrolase [Brevibacillus dissolubilis]|uniref:alpha/beta fold hydrolase n=1 Tax=Brevibacillus dissolubilis TaxID=1844116 RepID=UPI0011169DE6|nr:alpha/beta hydrolase [Brevibacillus dissolubilis]
MDYLSELKDLVVLHARSQHLNDADLKSLLNRVQREEGDDSGSWAYEWIGLGNQLLSSNKTEQAIQCYNFARFPYIDSTVRQKAHNLCIQTFLTLVEQSKKKVEIITVPYQGNEIKVYAAGLDHPNRPLLFVIGGIVSIKEQWSKFLFASEKLGFGVVVAECPGVGENPLVYDENSHQMIGCVLDALAGRIDVSSTYYVGMSFGGQLGIQQALVDKRIRGITTVGAPLCHFYRDQDWWKTVPETTKRTLAHLMKKAPDEVFEHIQSWQIRPDDMKKLQIPLHYVFSLRDEIIPLSEKAFLLENVQNLELLEFDDVHGSPGHMGEIQKYIPLSVLRQQRSNLVMAKFVLGMGFRLEAMKRVFRQKFTV